MVTGGGLAGEDPDPRHPVAIRFLAHGLIKSDGFQNVQQLALVFVDPLDLDIEDRVGIELDVQSVHGPIGQHHFVGAPDLGQALMHGRVVGKGCEPFQRVRIVQHTFPNRFDQQAGKAWVRLEQPTAERDAVRFVYDPVRIQQCACRGTRSRASGSCAARTRR